MCYSAMSFLSIYSWSSYKEDEKSSGYVVM